MNNTCSYLRPKFILFSQDTFITFALREILMDPEIFEEPEKFKPERFLDRELKSKLIAFGLGKYSCCFENECYSLIYFEQKN